MVPKALFIAAIICFVSSQANDDREATPTVNVPTTPSQETTTTDSEDVSEALAHTTQKQVERMRSQYDNDNEIISEPSHTDLRDKNDVRNADGVDEPTGSVHIKSDDPNEDQAAGNHNLNGPKDQYDATDTEPIKISMKQGEGAREPSSSGDNQEPDYYKDLDSENDAEPKIDLPRNEDLETAADYEDDVDLNYRNIKIKLENLDLKLGREQENNEDLEPTMQVDAGLGEGGVDRDTRSGLEEGGGEGNEEVEDYQAGEPQDDASEPLYRMEGIPDPPDLLHAAYIDRSTVAKMQRDERITPMNIILTTYIRYKNREDRVVSDTFQQVFDRERRTWSKPDIVVREYDDTPDAMELKEEELYDEVDAQATEPHDLSEQQQKATGLFEDAQRLISTGSYTNTKRAYLLLKQASYLGHVESKEMIAFSHFHGDYLPQNFTKAHELFTQLANEGNARAQLGLGLMYAAGVHYNSSQAKALVYFTFSALAGDQLAQMILGYRYLSGIGVEANCENALIYYSQAAEIVASRVSVIAGGPAVHRIHLNEEAEPTSNAGTSVLDDDLIQYYQFLADKGEVQAQVALGQLYYTGGRGVAVDYSLAFSYFTRAADAGNADAEAYLGKMYAEGLGDIERDYQTAYIYFKKAADQNNPVGQAGLGLLYLHGHAVKKDLNEALRYFTQSADKEWVDGLLQLGLMYHGGIGVKQEYKQALKYFNLAAQRGNVLAFYNLAQMHATGSGVMRACHTAVEFYKNVVERGPWSKILMEAYDFYIRGYTDVATLKYVVAAELGYEVAQSNVGHLLDTGESRMFESNEKYKRALLQWSRAATQGSTSARIKLGDYFYYGLGTDVDYEVAVQHYRVAGEQQNNPQAIYNLAYMHETGLGLKQDLHLAKRFYDRAAEISKEAQIPVSLALTRLSFISSLEYFSNTSKLWQSLLHLHPQSFLGPSWDIYIITLLALLLGLILVLRHQVIRV